MSTFSFENEYGNISYFEFYTDRMSIREIWIGGLVREFMFKYSDINRYSIKPITRGYWVLTFFANNREIEVVEKGKIKNSKCEIFKMKAKVSDSALYNKYTIEDGENDIRKVIYDNTPLRTELDMQIEKVNYINKLYKETSDENYGIVYLSGPRKNMDNYGIEINGVTLFYVYTAKSEKKLREAGQYFEHLAKPAWVNNNTLAFRIPYGNWNIRYTFHNYGMGTVDGPRSVNIIVNNEHREVRLMSKIGLFENKIIEI